MSFGFLLFCGLFIFAAQYLSHYYLAYKLNYNPVIYYEKGLASITFKAETFDIIKIISVFLIGPIVEIYFILFGIIFEIPEIYAAGLLSLLTDYHVFKKLYDLFKYRDHFRTFNGYFGT